MANLVSRNRDLLAGIVAVVGLYALVFVDVPVVSAPGSVLVVGRWAVIALVPGVPSAVQRLATIPPVYLSVLGVVAAVFGRHAGPGRRYSPWDTVTGTALLVAALGALTAVAIAVPGGLCSTTCGSETADAATVRFGSYTVGALCVAGVGATADRWVPRTKQVLATER